MRRLFVVVAMALALTGCALPMAAVPSALDRADAAFTRIQAAAELVLPALPPSRAVRIRAIMATIAIAIDAARSAPTPAARESAIARLDAQVAALSAALH